MPRIIITLVGVALLSAAFTGDTSPARQDSPATEAVSSILGCPQLKRDQSDPVDGKNCVRELQTILRDLGYDQPVTGTFAEYTEANVKDFQRRHNIEAIGVIGPKTRAALVRDSTSSAPLTPSYSTDLCTGQQCDLYLSRTTTRRYAQLIIDHPLAATAISTAILRTACARVLKLSVATIACQVVADHHAVRIKNTLAAAARQQACLHITLKRPDTPQSPLAVDTSNSSRCKD